MHFAHAIADQDERLIKAAEVERAGRMRQVVWHGQELPIPIHARKIMVQVSLLDLRTIQLLVLLPRILRFLEGVADWFVSESMSQAMHFVDLNIARLQTV